MKQLVSEKWLVTGDFNMILQASDKSNSNLNRWLSREFREAVQELELNEINLRGRKFAWSNDRTQTRIDRVFCSMTWDLMMPGVFLHALSSKVSDHRPLVVAGTATIKKYKGFRFEAFWPRLGYQETVSEAGPRILQ
jgi:endonuclease/exonuclease/phosphatase family metal-dependent hydrolase